MSLFTFYPHYKLGQFLSAVTCKFHLPVKVAILAGVVAALGLLSTPNQYKSEARILPSEQKPSIGGLAVAAASMAGINLSAGDSQEATYVDILDSRSLLEELVQIKYKYKARKWLFGVEFTYEQDLLQYLNAKNLDQALKLIKKHFTVVRDLKTKLITVTVETESPELNIAS